MTNRTSPLLPSSEDSTVNEKVKVPEKSGVNRRAFLRNSMVAGAAVTVGAGILGDSTSAFGQQSGKSISKGDAAILRFLAAAEIIESDLWLLNTQMRTSGMETIFPLRAAMTRHLPKPAARWNSIHLIS